MKSLTLRLLGLVSLFLVLQLSNPVHAQSAYTEQINNFDVTIQITETGHINVTELIEYNFGANSRHGIYRNIPYLKTNDNNDRLIMDFSNITVTDENGSKYQFSKSQNNQEISLKIGDPDKIITGTHKYIINYTVAGALTYFDEYDELYWNVTGTDWEVPILSTSAQLLLPANFPQGSRFNLKGVCYVGVFGSTAQTCKHNIAESGPISYTFSTINTLNSNEGLTVVLNFPKGYVTQLEPRHDRMYEIFQTLKLIALGLVILLWGLLTPAITFLYWYKGYRNTKNKEKIVAAWFSPPKDKKGKNFTPAETGLILNKTVNTRLITATLIHLAQRGFLKIVFRKKNDYDFVKLKEFDDPELADFEKTLLRGLFIYSSSSKLNLTGFTSKLSSIKEMMADGKIDEKEQEEIARMFVDTTTVGTVNVKSLKNSTTFPGVVQLFYKQISKSVVKEGLFTRNPETVNNIFSVVGVMSLMFLNPLMSLISFVFGRKATPRTDLGIEKYSEAKSLENFIKSQDEQLDFQAHNQMFFEKLLPYASAYGVEDVWAKRFKDIQFTQSDWYEGSTYSAMNFSSFSNSLNSSVRSYSSTSSSGSSGGSSGGGGGGGGGGSW